jgi:integrin beta 8
MQLQLEDMLGREIAEIIKEHTASIKMQFDQRIAALEARMPQKGDRGEIGLQGPRGEKGDRGDIGLRGEVGIPGKDGKDGKDGRDGLSIHGEKGEPGPPGPPGQDGKDGVGPSRGRYRGPWKHDDDFHLDDMVSCGGNGWVCMIEGAKDKPGDSKQWQLFVRKGSNGKDGERGPPGPIGPTGKYEP